MKLLLPFSDNQAPASAPGDQSAAGLLVWNGNAWDRWRGVTEDLVALPSAARNATTSSDVLINHSSSRLWAVLDVTANPGAAQTLNLILVGVIGNVSANLAASNPNDFGGGPGAFFLAIGPGITSHGFGGVGGTSNQCVLPRKLRFQVQHSGAGAWTYSVTYILAP